MALTVRRLGRVAGLALGGVGVLLLYLLAIWKAPEYLTNRDLLVKTAPEQRMVAEHNARLIVISIGGALVVGAGLLYTARSYRLAQRGQITERFTKALERLEADQLYVRIGGVRALEHVMRESPVHHSDVVEVLVAFVRDRVPHVAAPPLPEGRWRLVPREASNVDLPAEPTADVQAALTALGRRPQRAEQEEGPLNLRQLHLQGAYLYGAKLQRADLRETNLREADLTLANLKAADLWSANLQYADLDRAKLKSSRLGDTNLQGAHLGMADLRNAYLGGANLHEAALPVAKLTVEQLRQAVVSERTTLPAGFTLGPSGEIWEKDAPSEASDAVTDQHKPTS